jgi:hypothetical protein
MSGYIIPAIGKGSWKIGDLVRFIPPANENTPGWSEKIKDRVGIVLDYHSNDRQDWIWVNFTGEEVYVYHDDLEKVG